MSVWWAFLMGKGDMALRWSREQLWGIAIMVLLGCWMAVIGIQNNIKLSPPPRDIQQITIGDEWVYEAQDVGYPQVLRIKAISAQPPPDGLGRNIVCRYTLRRRHLRRPGYVENSNTIDTLTRDYLFTQYTDGTLVWRGSASSGELTSTQLTTLLFLPVLRSPLMEGTPVEFATYAIPSERDSPGNMGSFQYEVAGVEGVRFERRRQAAYRVEIHETRQGPKGSYDTKWTEWYAGYAFPVRREYILDGPSNIPLPSFRLELTLVEFIPGKP